MSARVCSRREFLRGRVSPALVAFTSNSARDLQSTNQSTSQANESRVARLDPRRCLGASSQICTVCLERCGEIGAISLEGMVPRIDPARCTGCGLCVHACPAPESALRLIPRAGATP